MGTTHKSGGYTMDIDYDEGGGALNSVAMSEGGGTVNGQGITVSYWDSEAAIVAWKKVVAHAAGQKLGRERWYKHYRLRVAKVERAYSGPEGRG